jgi:hypothetical protein
MALEKFRAPAIPLPSPEYDAQYLSQLVRALRLYFNQLDSLTPNQAESYRADRFIGGDFTGETINANTVNTEDLSFFQANCGDINADYANLAEVFAYFAQIDAILTNQITASTVTGDNFYGNFFYGSGRFLNVPYNQFLSNVDQTFTLGTAKSVRLEVTNFANGIFIAGANDDEITFSESGVYSITYSLSFKNTSNEGQFIDIWIEYNGTDYANSNTRFFIPVRKSNNEPSFLVAVTTITGLAQAANDYVRIMWHASSTNVVMEHLPAVTAVPNVTPNIPETPSALVQANFISAEYPPVKRVSPLSVFGFGKVGAVEVVTNLG